LFFLLTVLGSCITPYEPDIESSEKSKYVVSGTLTDDGKVQTVYVSRTSSLEYPGFLGISNCMVTLSDKAGNTFQLNDDGGGKYTIVLDSAIIKPGISFRVNVHIPDGTDIQSDYDSMPSCPEIDSVYYIRKDLATGDEGIFIQGIQFYTDLDGTLDQSRNFRWEAIETYEYHSEYPLEWWYDGRVHHVVPPDYSRMICWRTTLIKNIYTLTTSNLAENKSKGIPLHFVDNTTTRLAYGYSLLLRQYALSEAAFNYYDQLRVNGVEVGGLYEQQPLAVQGNMHCLTDPDNSVLGFFSCSSVKVKRIFIRKVEGLELDFYNACTPMTLIKGLPSIPRSQYPAYLLGDGDGYQAVLLNKECVNCLLRGGTNVKPDFWPE